jgi:hypothetical protein
MITMKKILLLLVLIATCSLVQAQTKNLKFKAYDYSEGKIDPITDKWKYGKDVPTTITFALYEEYLTASDDARSIYRFTEQLFKEDNEQRYQVGWRCLDERNRECIVKIVVPRNSEYTPVIYVFYEKWSIRYGVIFL